MAKKPVASLRFVSILVGITIGCILAYAYQANLPTLYHELNAASLVVFVTIPLLAGFLVGVLSPDTGAKDGFLVGLIIGLFNSVVAAVKLVLTTDLAPSKVFPFSLFAVMSVFIWMILAGAAGELATKLYQ